MGTYQEIIAGPNNMAFLLRENQWLIWETSGKFMDILGGGNSNISDPWGDDPI